MLPSIMARRSVFHSLGHLAGLPVSCRMASSSFVSPACGSSIPNTGSQHRYPSLLQTRGKHRAFEASFLQARKANYQPLSPLSFLERTVKLYPRRTAVAYR
ncbi:hypothetical protein Naga_100495g2 [Nannochloropsis gaditana]|uniref:Uncharacterized protein n=1 Tax=Nannochloropsis gaditana TaxID=72520 RepID=W7TQT9_9STRA|nr:hypothetical protein Naga_100495g2 [Nannochloropsis gaditana]